MKEFNQEKEEQKSVNKSEDGVRSGEALDTRCEERNGSDEV